MQNAGIIWVVFPCRTKPCTKLYLCSGGQIELYQLGTLPSKLPSYRAGVWRDKSPCQL